MNLANSLLAFALELALLAAIAIGAWHVTATLYVQIASAILALAVVSVVWGIWLAPRAKRRLEQPGRVILKLALFAVGAVCLYMAGRHFLAVVFLLLALLNQGLEYFGVEVTI